MKCIAILLAASGVAAARSGGAGSASSPSDLVRGAGQIQGWNARSVTLSEVFGDDALIWIACDGTVASRKDRNDGIPEDETEDSEMGPISGAHEQNSTGNEELCPGSQRGPRISRNPGSGSSYPNYRVVAGGMRKLSPGERTRTAASGATSPAKLSKRSAGSRSVAASVLRPSRT